MTCQVRIPKIWSFCDTAHQKNISGPATCGAFSFQEGAMLGILFFVAIFSVLGVYLWREHKAGKATAEMSKLDAAVKAEAERLKKLIP